MTTKPTPKPIPPKDCICASFWTVRQKHKSDCPLATEPVPEEVEKIVDRLFFAGYQAHKASLDSRNAGGLRHLEDSAKLDATTALASHRQATIKEVVERVRTEVIGGTSMKGYLRDDLRSALDKIEEDLK